MNKTATLTALDPYVGEWDYERAAHLLRRATFGPRDSMIKQSVAIGMEATVNQLLLPTLEVDPPIIFDPEIPNFGAAWPNLLWPTLEVNTHYQDSLFAWVLKNTYRAEISIQEKMVLFWQSHFSIHYKGASWAQMLHNYISTLRENYLGNFRELIQVITINPAMLTFLDGRVNTKDAPNENYARELLELYTVGKGPIAASGDYTTFTENDVSELSKALTGWYEAYAVNPDGLSSFHYAKINLPVHTPGEKVLSHRFNNAVIPDLGAEEYLFVVDTIFEQAPQTIAEFMCSKLYRFFVNSKIDETINQEVIIPLANIFIAEDFNTQPVIETLLKSNHFYESCHIGVMIKSPIDYVSSLFNQLDFYVSSNIEQAFKSWSAVHLWTEDMAQIYLGTPNLAGWKAYYQEPLYYRTWINASTMQARKKAMLSLVHGNEKQLGHNKTIDFIAFSKISETPENPVTLIKDWIKLLYAVSIDDNRIDEFKSILLSGQDNDSYWNQLYLDYLDNPNDEILRESVTVRLRNLLEAILDAAEFHLM